MDSAIEVGRTTSSAPAKSAIEDHRVGARRRFWRSAARTAGLADQREQVGGDEPGRTPGDVVQVRRPRPAAPPRSARRAARGARPGPAAAPTSSWSSRPGRAQLRVDRLRPAGGADHRDAGARRPRATTSRSTVASGPGVLARRERLDVVDQQHGRRRPARLGQRLAQRRRGRGRAPARRAPAPRARTTRGADRGGDRPDQRGLAGPGRAGDQHARAAAWCRAGPAPRGGGSRGRAARVSCSACDSQPGQVVDGRDRLVRRPVAPPVASAGWWRPSGRAAGGGRAVLPADHGVHGDQRRPGRLGGGHGEQRAGPGHTRRRATGCAGPAPTSRSAPPAARPAAAARRCRRS